jgi:hypothetical protein
VSSRPLNLLAHYLAEGHGRGVVPTADFDERWYVSQYHDVAGSGLNPFEHFVTIGLREGRRPKADFVPANQNAGHRATDPHAVQDASDIVLRRFQALAPLPVFRIPGSQGRINLVTDSVGKGSLFGGVGTAIGLAGFWASALGVPLRIVTRTERAETQNVRDILRLYGVRYGEVELAYSGYDAKDPIPLADGEQFLTTSWWTTWGVRQSVSSERIVYLLQEDERMFYPHGDDRLYSTELLRDSQIRKIVNSQMLYNHFLKTNVDLKLCNGLWFEPAFPKDIFFREVRTQSDKKNFFFYARPNHLRNLFYRGLAVIVAAMEAGLLDPREWDFYFVGVGVPRLRLPGRVEPRIVEGLNWRDYAALIRRMDLGFSLMDTPHPSYPPLDLAACGAAVVTNRHPGKDDLAGYSGLIITADTPVPAMVDALRAGIVLAKDEARREELYRKSQLSRSWEASMSAVIGSLTRAG